MPDRDPVKGDARQIRISVIIPVYNGGADFGSCLTSLSRSSFADFECIVADDGSTDGSADLARTFGAQVVSTNKRRGPAHARNLGAARASGEILLFIDADVCTNANVLDLVNAAFRADPDLDGIIGSYDDTPTASNFLSRYRNLMHCYVHRNARREAFTFWSGCGAIRRNVFLEAGGFDEKYRRPSIEDIELGYRLVGSGRKLVLDPNIMVKHLKRWSLQSIIRTDILDRGIPWTELILRDRRMPNDLNLKVSHRFSVALMAVLLVMAAMAAFRSGREFVLTFCMLVYLAIVQLAASLTGGIKRDRMLAVGSLVLATSVLAQSLGAIWVIPLTLSVFPLLFVRHWLASRELSVTRAVSKICAAYILIAGATVLFRFSHSAAYGFYLALSLLVLLNFPFYWFLAERMGKLNALAAIPFHLLFYLYSGFSFLAGIIKYAVSGFSARR
jgi:glycosyltransferase involved in cell wall biosynthesis